MRSRQSLVLAVLLLASCRQATSTPGLTPAVATAIRTTAGPAAEAATLPPTIAATEPPTTAPGGLPPTTVPPTPTSFAEGLTTRLGTPDPNPDCPNHYPWFFENAAAECADFVLNVWTVFQPFQHGNMVWFQEGGRTLVMLDDGTLFKPYQQVFDLQGLPLPEPDPSLVPPPGLYAPTLGFALFWRGLVPGHEWVRESLGWATAPETAYSGLYQCNTAAGDAHHCYFTGPRDEVISLTVGSVRYWNYLQRAVR